MVDLYPESDLEGACGACAIFPTTYNGIRTKNRPVWIPPGAAPIRWMGPIRNPRWEQKRTVYNNVPSIGTLRCMDIACNWIFIFFIIFFIKYSTFAAPNIKIQLPAISMHVRLPQSLISMSIQKRTLLYTVRFCSQRGLRIGPIQRMGAAPGGIHTGRFFVLIPL
jgi:hypothetical protein